MRADSLNLQVYPVRTEMTDPYLHFCSTDEEKSKGIITHETLSQSCSTEEDESKVIIVSKTLSQICSTDEEKLCSME